MANGDSNEDQSTLIQLIRAVGDALLPLQVALQDLDTFQELMMELGWEIEAFLPPVQNLSGLIQPITDALESAATDPTHAPALLARLDSFFQTVRAFASQPDAAFPGISNAIEFKDTFPRELVDYLLAQYLLNFQPGIGNVLLALGILRLTPTPATASRIAYTKREVAWNDLGQFLSDPFSIVKKNYQWGSANFDGQRLIDSLSQLGRALPLDVYTAPLEDSLLDFLSQATDTLELLNLFQLTWNFVDLVLEPDGSPLRAGLGVYILPAVNGSLPGFSILPFASGADDLQFLVTDTLSLTIKAAFDMAGGVALLVRPNQVELLTDIIHSQENHAAPPPGMEVALKLAYTGDTIFLFGEQGGSHVELAAFDAAGGARLRSSGEKTAYVEFSLHNAKIVLSFSGDGVDSFLTQMLPSNLEINFSLDVGFDSKNGIYFSGSSGLEILLPAHISLGPVEVMSALIALRPESGKVPLVLGGTLRGSLGPLEAVIENVGLKAVLTFPDGGGKLGPADFDLGFKPPDGVGLLLDAGVIKGGGFLYIDPDRGQYAGALELIFGDFLQLKAIGVITTRMPDGSSGFSLLIIITVDFGPTGIQLGFGFSLLAVGGLLGHNRTMRLQALADGVRAGALDGILFPRDVIANAPRIISDLNNFFPPENDHFLIGPMAKLGWGAPALIQLSLGILIEIPGNVAIIGVLRVAMPTEDEALLVLQVSFIGAIEFDKKRVWFFATLFESRIMYVNIDGEMGVLASFGDDSNLVISVGGFHPRFNPPPLPFPSPRHVSIDIVNQPGELVHVEGYFAVTSNTAQFGAHLYVKLGFDDFGIQGHLGFDALFTFSPFTFIVDISGSVSLDAFGVGVFSIDLHLTLSGPSPYRARGTGSLDMLFFSISADFDITWGDVLDLVLPGIEVLTLLKSEFDRPENWKAELPAANNLLVTLRKLDTAQDTLVLHPVGALRVSQKAVPLDLTIDKVGEQKPSDVNRVNVTVATGGLDKTADATEPFAMGQFQEMSDDEKLTRPAYEPGNSGVVLSVQGQDLQSGRMVMRVVRYDLTIIDSNYKRFARRFFNYVGSLFNHFLAGNSAARSPVSQGAHQQYQPFADKVQVNSQAYTVAFSDTNHPYQPEAVGFASEAMAREYLRGKVEGDPNLADVLHVIPQYEVNP